MKNIWLKILLTSLMLVPVPFSCTDENKCLGLYVEPYFDIQGMIFSHIDMYHRYYHKGKPYIQFDIFNLDYDNNVYPCDSMAIYIKVPDTLLMYHSKQIMKPRFSFTQEAFAECDKPGYAGTKELVDKIYISSNYPFDDTHNTPNFDLSDIVDIFTYTREKNEEKDNWMTLREYNSKSPYEAPKRFYLMIKRKPTLSKIQQFVIKYYMVTQPGDLTTEYYIITTPVFHVR
jgi:hypothetical protein